MHACPCAKRKTARAVTPNLINLYAYPLLQDLGNALTPRSINRSKVKVTAGLWSVLPACVCMSIRLLTALSHVRTDAARVMISVRDPYCMCIGYCIRIYTVSVGFRRDLRPNFESDFMFHMVLQKLRIDKVNPFWLLREISSVLYPLRSAASV